MNARTRIEALIDPGSWLETGRLARSQQPSVAESTPADGLICGYARVADREVAVLCEDPEVLARTDGQVARNKRHRMLATSVTRGLAIVYIADAPDSNATFAPGEGELFGHLGHQYPEPRLDRLRAPIIAVVFGQAEGSSARLVQAADVTVGSDVVFYEDVEAMTTVRRLLELLPRAPRMPLERGPVASPVRALHDESQPEELGAGLWDEGSVIAFTEQTGVARLDGWPVCYAVAHEMVTAADLEALRVVARLSAKHEVPLLMIQDTGGYEGDIPPDLAQEVYLSIRRSRGAKLALVVGRGHVLGDFAYGGRACGVDYVCCWPDAEVGCLDVPVYRPGAIPDGVERGALLAAGLGVVDDVLLPSETRDRLARMVALMAPARAYPSLEEDRGGRLVDDIAKV
jgi:acetyl-CoA carboxylase carboxyltransferase component